MTGRRKVFKRKTPPRAKGKTRNGLSERSIEIPLSREERRIDSRKTARKPLPLARRSRSGRQKEVTENAFSEAFYRLKRELAPDVSILETRNRKPSRLLFTGQGEPKEGLREPALAPD
jgi:hypothetical protein